MVSRKYVSVFSTLALAVSLAGCGDNSTPPPPAAPAAPTPAASAPVTPAVTPAPELAPTATMASPPVVPPTPVMPAMPATMPTTAPTAATDTQAQAETLLTQGVTYIKENKLDLASKTVDQLEKMKPSLPTSLGQRIDQLKMALDAKQAANGKLPGGIKIPGM